MDGGLTTVRRRARFFSSALSGKSSKSGFPVRTVRKCPKTVSTTEETMLRSLTRPIRRVTRVLGFDLLPIVLFVLPMMLPVLWLVLQLAVAQASS
jgi:hypothetical protein